LSSEQAFFATRAPAQSAVDGNLGEPREAARPEQAKRAEGSVFCDAIIARLARFVATLRLTEAR
jgi:hypothetical protein